MGVFRLSPSLFGKTLGLVWDYYISLETRSYSNSLSSVTADMLEYRDVYFRALCATFGTYSEHEQLPTVVKYENQVAIGTDSQTTVALSKFTLFVISSPSSSSR